MEQEQIELNEIRIVADSFGKSHMVITWSNGREQGVALEGMSPYDIRKALLHHVSIINNQVESGVL